jgi:hypothetical protein
LLVVVVVVVVPLGVATGPRSHEELLLPILLPL